MIVNSTLVLYLVIIFVIIVICFVGIVNCIDDKMLDLNTELNSLYQNEVNKTDILLKIIKEIQKELKLTQLKDCPKEELKQIPKEIIYWIDKLFEGEEQCQKEK